MRHDGAPAERLLWSRLRSRQLGGFKFRRQAPLGFFIADFYCVECDLVVELDGESHQERASTDRVRSNILQREGHRVIRFWNTDVFKNVEAVLEAILLACERTRTCERTRSTAPPHPNPLPEGEGTR